MAWIEIIGIRWEYSTTPEVDDPINTHNYTGRHSLGKRVNSDDTEIYVYCRQLDRTAGKGYGEISKSHLDGTLVYAFLGSHYEDGVYELLPIVHGIEPAGHTHSADIYRPDHEVMYRVFEDGECLWDGGRVVRNELLNNNSFASTGWNNLNPIFTTGVDDPNGGFNATTFEAGATDAFIRQVLTLQPNDTAINSIWARRRNGVGRVRFYNTDTTTFDINGIIDSTWKRIAGPGVAWTAADTFKIRIYIQGDSIDIYSSQCEKSTGRSNPDIPGEVISTTDAPVQKVFATTNGNTVTDNVVTENEGTPLVPVPRQVSQQAGQNDISFSRFYNDSEVLQWDIRIVDDISLNIQLSPFDGLASFLYKSIDAVVDYHYLRRSYTDVPIGTHTAKFLVKSNTHRYAGLRVSTGTVLTVYDFDTNSIVLTGSDVINTNVKTIYDDWKLISIDFNNTIVQNILFSYVLTTATGDADLQHSVPVGDGFFVDQAELHLNKTIDQVKNLGPIFTSGGTGITDAVLNTIPAANISNTSSAGNFKVQTDGSQMIFDRFISYGLGAEILTNWDFEDWTDPTVPDGWVKGGTHDANNYVEESPNDHLHLVSDGTGVGVTQSVLTSGKRYFIETNTISNIGNGWKITYTGLELYFTETGYDSLVTEETVGIGFSVYRQTLGMSTDAIISYISVRQLAANTNFQITDIEGNTCEMPEIDDGDNYVAWNADAALGIMSITVNGTKSTDTTYCGQLIPEAQEALEWFMDQQYPATVGEVKIWAGGKYDDRQALVEAAQS